MILTKEVEITLNSANFNHFKLLGYENLKSGNKLIVPVEHLTKGSHTEIDVKCDVCGFERKIVYKYYYKNIEKYGYYSCSTKCAQEKIHNTLIKKYGLKEKTIKEKIIKEKIIKEKPLTLLEKYGVKNVFEIDEIKNKIKKTNLEKYGVENVSQSEIVKEKRRKTMLEKYGNEVFYKTNYFKENTIYYRNKKNEKFITDIKLKYEKHGMEFLNYKDNLLIFKCKKGHDYKINGDALYKRLNVFYTEPCTICNPINSSVSEIENKFANFIKENYNDEILYNNRKILDGEELDIYLPKLRLAFEFNGLFWHSELYRNKYYHKNKTKKCLNKNIELIHIYEDEWIYKQDIIKSIILNKLNKTQDKIYARKCTIKEIKNNKIINDFLEENHIQGKCKSSIKIGLYYNEELVSLMVFGKNRLGVGNINNKIYELLRFCSKLNTNVVGGASKLFSYFIKNYTYNNIITFADTSFSTGNIYKILNFKYVYWTQPNYYYIINGIRKHRFNYRKNTLIKKGFDSNKSEHEIMLERGIYRIYNSGNYKYIF